MEDLVIPVLNSGIAEDEQKPISSDASASTTSQWHHNAFNFNLILCVGLCLYLVNAIND